MQNSTAIGESYIVRAPGILGGKPHIEGHRLGVHTIVNFMLRQGGDAEEAADSYNVSLAQVHAALAYYYDHPAEIDAILDENLRLEKELSDPAQIAELHEHGAALMREWRSKLDSNAELTAAEIAAEFGLATATVRIAIQKGWLAARKSGATWLIKRRDAEARWGDR